MCSRHDVYRWLLREAFTSTQFFNDRNLGDSLYWPYADASFFSIFFFFFFFILCCTFTTCERAVIRLESSCRALPEVITCLTPRQTKSGTTMSRVISA
ncbi:hypothetical protein LZ31DRAFT_101852 [Colletotrichum somersetense]|nr:hypothetical protein LZ31DRAFT_101852 [Colletotrichum somersetense]